MKKNFPLALFLSFSVSIFLLLVLGTWQLNKNFVVNKNNKNFKNRNQENAVILFSLPDKRVNSFLGIGFIRIDFFKHKEQLHLYKSCNISSV